MGEYEGDLRSIADRERGCHDELVVPVAQDACRCHVEGWFQCHGRDGGSVVMDGVVVVPWGELVVLVP